MERWMEDAACRGEDPEKFFPFSRWDHQVTEEQMRAPRAVCDRCPVRADCLDYAIRHGIPDGVFGGMAPHERPKPAPRKRRPWMVDDVAVERAVVGRDVGRKLTNEEVAEATREYMRRTGLSPHAAGEHLHVGPHKVYRLLEAS